MDLKNNFREFIIDIWGFLFSPSFVLKEKLEAKEETGLFVPGLYILYMTLILGVTMWFFIFYPEPLYFGTSGVELQREIPSILIANPWHSLFVVLAVSFVIIFLYTWIASGALSFGIMRLLAKEDSLPLGSYLGIYAYSMTPLLFWVPVMVCRSFFYEKWVHLRPMWPFFDWTLFSSLHLIITAAFILWQLVIVAKINRSFFRVSASRAAVPVLVLLVLFVLILLFPFTLNDIFFNLLKDGLV